MNRTQAAWNERQEKDSDLYTSVARAHTVAEILRFWCVIYRAYKALWGMKWPRSCLMLPWCCFRDCFFWKGLRCLPSCWHQPCQVWPGCAPVFPSRESRFRLLNMERVCFWREWWKHWRRQLSEMPLILTRRRCSGQRGRRSADCLSHPEETRLCLPPRLGQTHPSITAPPLFSPRASSSILQPFFSPHSWPSVRDGFAVI